MPVRPFPLFDDYAGGHQLDWAVNELGASEIATWRVSPGAVRLPSSETGCSSTTGCIRWDGAATRDCRSPV